MFENIHPDAIAIGSDLYCKNPEALVAVKAELVRLGYGIKDCRVIDKWDADRGVTVEMKEKNGWSLWYASLEVRRAKCGSCNEYISMRGVESHGHACEKCGAITYRHVVDGTSVRFRFPSEKGGMADIRMKAKRWDAETGELYLYPEVKGGVWQSDDQARTYFDDNAAYWKAVEVDGEQLVVVTYFYHRNPEKDDVAINMSDTSGHERNFTTVRVLDGKEYGEWDRKFPLPKSVSVYETWHWAPLAPSPRLHEKLFGSVHSVSDKSYWYQDGRPAFDRELFRRMGIFVRHFTTLDADAWDEALHGFRLDGPGGIDDVARFCHPNPAVENRPNIGNVLVGASKIAAGKRLTEGELDAMAHGLSNDRIAQEVTDLVTAIEKSRKADRKSRRRRGSIRIIAIVGLVAIVAANVLYAIL